MSHSILVGTCNWLDHESFYPPELAPRSRGKERLTFYATYFPVVEVDTTFYGRPRPQVTEGWVERTPPGFRFDVKAYRSLTRHEREGGRPRPPTRQEETEFLQGLEPLRDAGRLVAVEYQFPPWFTKGPGTRDVLLEARDRHPDDVVAVEFRHRSWFEDWPETEDLLRELDMVFVGVDAPQIGTGTAPRHLAITSPRLAIVRFHGRNRRTWYRRTATSAERFDYLYAPGELAQWVPTIVAAAEHVPVHVLMNNNRGNQAVVNAFDMARLLDIQLGEPPPPVAATIRARDRAVGASQEQPPVPPRWSDSAEARHRGQ